MAEKLLKGASFKAPDWKGPASRAVEAAATSNAESMPGVEVAEAATAAATMVPPALLSCTAPAAAPEPMDAESAAAGDSAWSPALHMPHAEPQVPAPLLQPPVATARRAVIVQPGWRPALQEAAAQAAAAAPMEVAGHSAEPWPPRTQINDLPDDLLQFIFSMLPFRKR